MNTDASHYIEKALREAFAKFCTYSMDELVKHCEENYEAIVKIETTEKLSVHLGIEVQDEDKTGFTHSINIDIYQENTNIYNMKLLDIVSVDDKHIVDYIDMDEVAHWIKRSTTHFEKIYDIRRLCSFGYKKEDY